MINQTLYKLNTAIVGIVFFFFNSCNGQSKQGEDCKLSYKNAKRNFNAYYKNNEQHLLQESLVDIEQAMKCEETKRSAIDLKISLLMLLKEYKNGYKFIDSLNETDFKTSYKKKMNYNYFLALEYESKADTVNENKLLNDIIVDIQNYIQKENNPKDKLDEEAYYDLFTVKRKVLNQQQVNTEINLLKNQYPNERDFFDALKESLSEEPKISIPGSVK